MRRIRFTSRNGISANEGLRGAMDKYNLDVFGLVAQDIVIK